MGETNRRGRSGKKTNVRETENDVKETDSDVEEASAYFTETSRGTIRDSSQVGTELSQSYNYQAHYMQQYNISFT